MAESRKVELPEHKWKLLKNLLEYARTDLFQEGTMLLDLDELGEPACREMHEEVCDFMGTEGEYECEHTPTCFDPDMMAYLLIEDIDKQLNTQSN